MIQQIIAVIIILFFLFRLRALRKNNSVTGSEYILWVGFWTLSILVVVFIKQVDLLVSYLGFSSSGIDVLLYLAIVVLFYFLFRLRLEQEKTNSDITKIVREIGLKNIKRDQ